MNNTAANSITATCNVTGTKGTRGPDDQLSLRFFCVIEGLNGCPPDRGLWRILVDQALAAGKSFEHAGRAVSAAVVQHVAYGFYMASNRAGVIENFSARTLAKACRLNYTTFHTATGVLRQLRVVQRTRASRRRAGVWRLNLGGLDWPAVRARAGKSASGCTVQPLSDCMVQPLKGTYVGQEHIPGSNSYPVANDLQAQADDQLPPGVSGQMMIVGGRAVPADEVKAEARRRLGVHGGGDEDAVTSMVASLQAPRPGQSAGWTADTRGGGCGQIDGVVEVRNAREG